VRRKAEKIIEIVMSVNESSARPGRDCTTCETLKVNLNGISAVDDEA
jgi:hypothetical protein